MRNALITLAGLLGLVSLVSAQPLRNISSEQWREMVISVIRHGKTGDMEDSNP
ncbi:MAG: hypothetical protein HY549_13020 [Elusimicrobia bacterium]|nr:hypothetical protein [Elusimicrobiota bacterium]